MILDARNASFSSLNQTLSCAQMNAHQKEFGAAAAKKNTTVQFSAEVTAIEIGSLTKFSAS